MSLSAMLGSLVEFGAAARPKIMREVPGSVLAECVGVLDESEIVAVIPEPWQYEDCGTVWGAVLVMSDGSRLHAQYDMRGYRPGDELPYNDGSRIFYVECI